MEEKYTMSLSLNVLNHLGINLYSNIPAVLSEIVANSWDADATEVNITVENGIIIIEDNGCGMSSDDINKKFLVVGFQKRETSKISIKYKRPYMGRKGIGKLSMFSIAKEVDVTSMVIIEDGSIQISSLRMDIDDIAAAMKAKDENKVSDYHPVELEINDDEVITRGTKITLRHLKKNISSLTSDYIKKRIARRFGIIGDEYNFSVKVNGDKVSIIDRDYFHKLSYIWYYGDNSKKYADFSTKATHAEKRNNTVICGEEKYCVNGWIGSVDTSGDLKDEGENLNKIVILVRGKLGQEDILSEYSEGGLYSKYLIGEIHADFFDDDSFDDMATTGRQEFKRDDDRFIALKEFVHNELKYIQGKWTDLRNESGEEKARELLPVIDTWFTTLKGDDKKYAKKMFGKINQTIVDDDKKREILKYSILAFEKLRYSKHLSAIDDINVENFEIIKDVFMGFDEIEATLYYQIIKERIEVIKKFQQITDDDMREKIIQEYLFDHLWLLDPSWERVEATEYMEKTVLTALQHEFDGLSKKERDSRLDLGYRKAAGKHIVIELKKAGRIIKIEDVVKQINKYRSALTKVLTDTNQENFSFEIIYVVGKPIDNDNSLDNRNMVEKTIAPYNARIVFYTELIENAFKAYNEYLQANKESQPLIDMFHQLEVGLDN